MTEQAPLFDVPELASDPAAAGPAEAGLVRAVAKGQETGLLVEEDLGMIGGALVVARALDAAHAIGGKSGGYMAAQLATPFREMLTALRLPAAVAPVPARGPAPASDDAPDWLRDTFGTAET